MSVRIVTDSTSDLPPEICRELDITVVPLTVNFGDTGYKNGVDLSADEFYREAHSSQTSFQLLPSPPQALSARPTRTWRKTPTRYSRSISPAS